MRTPLPSPVFEPTVELSNTLVQEIRSVLGIAHPRDPTLLLLWPKYRKRRRSKALVAARFVVHAVPVVVAIAIAVSNG